MPNLTIDTMSQEDQLSVLQSEKAQLMSDIGITDSMPEPEYSDADPALIDTNKLVPKNRDQIAARNAFSESELTGKPLHETLPANQANVEQDVGEANKLFQSSVTGALDSGKEANILQSAVQGDAQGVLATSAVQSDQVSPEDTFVATVSGESVDVARMDEYAKSLRANNKVGELIAKAEADQTWGLDTIASIMDNIFFPGHTARVDSEIVGSALGQEDLKTSIASEKYFNDLKDYYNTLDVENQDLFLENLYNTAMESSGTIFDNPAEVRSFFEKFQKYTTGDASLTNLFAATDLATYPIGLTISLAKGLFKSGNSVVAKALKNPEVAAKAVASDILEGTEISGVAQADLVNSALKIGKNPYTYNGQFLEGAEENIKKALAEQAASRDVQTLIDMSGPTGIDVTEYGRLVKKYNDFYETNATKEWQAFTEKAVDDTGVTYRVTAGDPASGGFYTPEHAMRYAERYGMDNAIIEETDDGLYLLHADYKHNFTLDDVSPLAVEKSWVSRLPSWLQFPMHALDKQVVGTRVIGVNQEDTARLAFERLWKDSEKGLTAADSKLVDLTMAQGDKAKTVFTPLELEAKGLTDKHIISYYKKRTIRDISHVIHNKALADRLSFLGNKEISYSGPATEGFQVAGKALTKEEAVGFVSAGKKKVASNLMGKTAEIQELDGAAIVKIYEDGGQLIRSMNTVKLGENHTDMFIAHSKDLETKQLSQVLPYNVGEVSRMYTDNHFVTMGYKGIKNGESAQVFNTIRTAALKMDADKWAKGMNEAMRIIKYATSKEGLSFTGRDVVKALSKYIDNPRDFLESIKNGDIPMDATFQAKFDREVISGSTEHSDNIVETLFSTGRLFTSKRNERLMRVFGDEAPIASPKEAMAKELSYIARFMNTATWRETSIDKLLKTFEGKIEPLQGATKYETAFYGKPTSNMTVSEEKYLEVLRNHLKTQLSVPSDEAIKFKKRMDAFATYLEGKGKLGQWGAGKALGMAHGSISQALRTAVFHSYLGLGNLAQTFVQANGAFVAMSVSPKFGLLAAKNAGALRVGIMLDSLGRKDALAVLAKTHSGLELGLSSPKEFTDTIELIRRSGILNSIKSSALHYVKEGAVNLDTHMAAYTGGIPRAIKHTGSQALKAGLIPFNRGEEFSRLVAMDVARREWIKANPGKSFLSRGAINEITARQEVLTLGMSRANTGRIQQGAFSIPFQFARYNWNLMESLLGRNFSAGEKVRLLAGSTLIYGTEGMGLTWLAEEIFGNQVKDMSKEQKIALSEGAISWALYKATGAETAIGTRIGPFKYFADNLKGISQGDLSAAAFMTGASGSFLTKELDFFNEVYRIYNVDGIDLGDKSGMYLNEALKTVSSGYSNTTKYMHAYWADGWVKNKVGSKTVQLSDMELILSTFGIKSLKEADVSKMYELEKSIKDTKKDLTNGLARLWNMYYDAKATGGSGENEYKQIQAYMQSIPSAILQDEVFMSAQRIVSGDAQFDFKMKRIEQQIRDGKTEQPLIPSVEGQQ